MKTAVYAVLLFLLQLPLFGSEFGAAGFVLGPVGLETLAATINEDTVTLEDMYEPYLLQQGFLTRTPRGRCVTQAAYDHLHIQFPGQQLSL